MVVYLVLEVCQYLDGSLPQMPSCALREKLAARLVPVSFDYYYYLGSPLLAFLKESFFHSGIENGAQVRNDHIADFRIIRHRIRDKRYIVIQWSKASIWQCKYWWWWYLR